MIQLRLSRRHYFHLAAMLLLMIQIHFIIVFFHTLRLHNNTLRLHYAFLIFTAIRRLFSHFRFAIDFQIAIGFRHQLSFHYISLFAFGIAAIG
jgi:hypothetical protein